jgi:hypothetical protein
MILNVNKRPKNAQQINLIFDLAFSNKCILHYRWGWNIPSDIEQEHTQKMLPPEITLQLYGLLLPGVINWQKVFLHWPKARSRNKHCYIDNWSWHYRCISWPLNHPWSFVNWTPLLPSLKTGAIASWNQQCANIYVAQFQNWVLFLPLFTPSFRTGHPWTPNRHSSHFGTGDSSGMSTMHPILSPIGVHSWKR